MPLRGEITPDVGGDRAARLRPETVHADQARRRGVQLLRLAEPGPAAQLEPPRRGLGEVGGADVGHQRVPLRGREAVQDRPLRSSRWTQPAWSSPSGRVGSQIRNRPRSPTMSRIRRITASFAGASRWCSDKPIQPRPPVPPRRPAPRRSRAAPASRGSRAPPAPAPASRARRGRGRSRVTRDRAPLERADGLAASPQATSTNRNGLAASSTRIRRRQAVDLAMEDVVVVDHRAVGLPALLEEGHRRLVERLVGGR